MTIRILAKIIKSSAAALAGMVLYTGDTQSLCQVDHDYAVESKIISTKMVRESLDAYLFMRNQ